MNLNKNQRIVLAVLAVLVCLGLFFMVRSVVTPRNRAIGIAQVVISKSPRHWSESYYNLDGVAKNTMQVKDGVLTITTTTQSGVLSITVKDQWGRVLFDEEDLGNATYAVSASGKVTVIIDAEDHEGSFDIRG